MIAGVAAMVAGLAGCGGTKKDADKTTEINVGYFNNVTHAQALYMKAQGTLDKAFDGKAKVKWTSFNAGPSEVEALFSGDIDIGYIGPVPAISANVKSKGDVSIISGASQAGAELVKAPGSKIESAKDLDGKTVAIPQIGNTQHLCLLKLLSDNGLKTVEEGGTVTVTAVENADIQNMMDQGNVDRKSTRRNSHCYRCRKCGYSEHDGSGKCRCGTCTRTVGFYTCEKWCGDCVRL